MSQENIVGGRQLDQLLQTLPAKIEANIMRAALAAGARVIAKEAKRLAPVGQPSNVSAAQYGGYAGALRDSVRVTSGKTKTGQVYASVKAGGRTKKGADVFYAHIVEYGARSHRIAPRGRGRLEIGGQFVAGAVTHPGVRPQPFMRPAADSRLAEAVAVMTQKIRDRLQKQGVDVPMPVDESDV